MGERCVREVLWQGNALGGLFLSFIYLFFFPFCLIIYYPCRQLGACRFLSRSARTEGCPHRGGSGGQRGAVGWLGGGRTQLSAPSARNVPLRPRRPPRSARRYRRAARPLGDAEEILDRLGEGVVCSFCVSAEFCFLFPFCFNSRGFAFFCFCPLAGVV